MNVSTGGLRVGIDIGGTFTDLLVFDADAGRFHIGKILTTPDEPSRAVIDGLVATLSAAGLSSTAVRGIVHGTTLVTNAIIERKGAKTALLTTRGFRDAVQIGREHRYDLYDLFLEMPKPLVPRDLRLELDERVLADGAELVAVSPGQVRELADQLVAAGVEAVAIALIHAWRDPAHERQVEALLAEYAPDLVVSTSSSVVPEIREYERASTTIANVYVRPVVSRYLHRLEESLAALGVRGSLLIMLSSGGTCTVETARTFPIRLIESGPAAGALAAAEYGRLSGMSDVLSFDMGGTTAKACLIDAGRPLTTSDFEVSRVYRFKKGSGLPIKVPVIEMIEIGAGGGSIARIDALGLLKVGPDSAGSDPGPACYGRGGTAPTVTDADLVLGYLDPAFFLGGRMTLDVNEASAAIERDIADPLGIDVLQAAWGIHQVVNENMANAARIHAIERGKDPRAYPIFAFGGAGPVHAWRVSRILQSPRLIVPLGAGVTSTVGFLVAPLAFDFVRSWYGRLDALDWPRVNDLLAEMEEEGRRILGEADVAAADITVTRVADLRYAGQGHEISVPLPPGTLTNESVAGLQDGFEAVYRSLFERIAPGNPVEALSWRVSVAGPRPDLPLDRLAGSVDSTSDPTVAIKGERPIYLPEQQSLVSAPVYDRYRLAPGAAISGPAVVEERESTLIVGPHARARVDALLSLVVEDAE
ncbi:MAG TPA: hydantoinase/oxoprolinase family protein [Thermomicrobiales bacterium]|nr:hydantoinase/oxoprolinase family protein [Thermomicrobiales bacterium]HRA32684.1 hydantoinase/oxoprolinase family protein [Thermomicrobiales bacterium]